MGLNSLVCIIFMILILLSSPISLSSRESLSNSTSLHSKQANLLHGSGHHVGAKEYDDTNDSSMDTTEDAQALNEDGERDERIHSFNRKGGHGKGGGANAAGHHTPSPHKNRSSYLSPPSSFISFMLPCILIFGFFFPLRFRYYNMD